MDKTNRGHNKPLHPEGFVIVWNNSHSIEEFIERTGMKKRSALARAKVMREKGIKLNRMTSVLQTVERIEEVKKLAAETADVWDIESSLNKYQRKK